MDNCFDQVNLKIDGLTGFDNFIGAWMGTSAGRTFVVDPGPANTVSVLTQALEKRGIDKLDYILLTHIHVDHAGGTGTLLKRFPEAKVVCHSKAASHLIAPARLLEGSRKVLGHLMDFYGDIEPVPEDALLLVEESDLDWIATPGHSPHHISFLIEGQLFAGESLGVIYPGTSGRYMRPATPPRFFIDTYRGSINRLFAVDCENVLFGHFGSLPYSTELLHQSLGQLDLWESLVAERKSDSPEDVLQVLLQEDPLLAGFSKLPPTVQERERIFMCNSVKGLQRVERD